MRCLKCLKQFEGEKTHYGLHIHCFLAWFGLSEIAEFTGLALKTVSKDPQAAEDRRQDISSFFHGKFRKYSATLAGVSYIMKVKESEAPELPDVEYLSNQIAEFLGIYAFSRGGAVANTS